MSPPRLFALRSYDWWEPTGKRFVVDDTTPFDPDLIFPIAGRRRPATPPLQRSER